MQASSPPEKKKAFSYLILLVFSVALQLILFQHSSFLTYHSHASFWYAPAGLSVALFLLLGSRAFPIVFLCVAATTLQNNPILERGADPTVSILQLLWYPLSHAVPYWAGVALLQRLTQGAFDARDPSHIVRFIVIIPFSAAGAAFLGLLGLSLFGGVPLSQAHELMAVRWIGDLAAALCLGIPIVYLYLMVFELVGADLDYQFVDEDDVHLKHLSLDDLAYLPIALLLFFASGFLSYTYPDTIGLSFTAYVMVLLLLWIIYKTRSPLIYVVLAILVFALASSVSALGLIVSAAEYQITMIAVGSIIYFTNAAVSSQRRALVHSEHVSKRLLTETREKESLQAHAAQLQLRSSRDGLTEVLNRAFFEEVLHAQYYGSVRKGGRHCLAFVDLNDFKEVNDRFGHHAGDQALKGTAKILMARSRKGDTVARYGGDEFVVILSDIASPDEADAIIGQWKRDVAALRLQEYPEVVLSISVGRAFFPGSSPNDNEMSILRAADQDMYKDKARKNSA